MSMHTPKIKTQYKQWLEKCKPGPVKAKVSASRTKQIVLVLVHNKGIVYRNYMSRGAKGSADYIGSALKMFMKAHCQKWPYLRPGERVFHLDNALVPTTQVSAGAPAGSPPPLLPCTPMTSPLPTCSSPPPGSKTGRPDLVLGPVQDKVRRGHQDSDWRRIHQDVPVLDRGLQKVCLYRRWTCREKLEKIFLKLFFFSCLLYFVPTCTSFNNNKKSWFQIVLIKFTVFCIRNRTKSRIISRPLLSSTVHQITSAF